MIAKLNRTTPKKKIVIVKNHFPVDNDPRVVNLIKMLRKEYRITYLGWNRETNFSKYSEKHADYFSVVVNRRAPVGLQSALFLPLWWFSALSYLLKMDWDALHVINFSSLPPSILAAKLRKKPVVYDIVETFEDQTALPTLFKLLIFKIDKFLMRYVEAVVLVDEMQIDEFGGIPNSNTIVVYDTPEPLLTTIKSHENHIFTLFHPGYLDKRRNLNIEALIEAVKPIKNIKVIFAGMETSLDI